MGSSHSRATTSQVASQHAQQCRGEQPLRNAPKPAQSNQAVQRLLGSGLIQPKLTINQPGDKFEQEADRVADQIMRMPSSPVQRVPPRIQRVCSECEEELFSKRFRRPGKDEILVQRTSSEGVSSYVEESVESDITSALGDGRPLPEASRSFLEPRFGRDLSQVRVHTSSAATETASAVNARAYTVGRNIVFAEGEFQPETSSGRRLLAHEITHTIQQGHGSPMAGKQVQRTLNDNHDLQAPRFSGNLTLEAAFDDERLISKKNNSTGPHVSLLQQSLIDMGYTLPGFGVDGIFGNETEAAVIRFQRDAGAVLIDGIVGPETMGLFDRHDTTLPGGVGPPQTTGPVPGPLPPPAATCDVPYTAVTFTLANQVASGVSPAALIRIVSVGGRDALQMRGIAPATYTPDVTIHAPSNAAAQAFQVGFASNLLTEFVEYFYTSAAVISSTLPTPTKDGRPLSSGNYDPVYVEGLTPTVNENFLADGDTRNLVWPDVPSEFAFVQLLDNAECAAQPGPADLVTAAFIDSFRTWVVARHRPSGCTRALHHIDWDLNWQTIVTMTAGGPTVAVVSNVINVTETDGDGSPAFIQGGQVPDDLLAANRVCV